MNREAFDKVQAEYEATGFPGICDRSSSECSPSKLATKMWRQSIGLAVASLATSEARSGAAAAADEEIYLFCDFHAPNNATNIGSTPSLDPALRPENLLDTISKLSGPGVAQLRSKLSAHFGIRLQSTGDYAARAQSRIVMQTINMSPTTPPLVVSFNQFILTSRRSCRESRV